MVYDRPGGRLDVPVGLRRQVDAERRSEDKVDYAAEYSTCICSPFEPVVFLCRINGYRFRDNSVGKYHGIGNCANNTYDGYIRRAREPVYSICVVELREICQQGRLLRCG